MIAVSWIEFEIPTSYVAVPDTLSAPAFSETVQITGLQTPAVLDGIVQVGAAWQAPGDVERALLSVDSHQHDGYDHTRPRPFTLDTTLLSDGNHELSIRMLIQDGQTRRWHEAAVPIFVANYIAPPPPPPPEPHVREFFFEYIADVALYQSDQLGQHKRLILTYGISDTGQAHTDTLTRLKERSRVLTDTGTTGTPTITRGVVHLRLPTDVGIVLVGDYIGVPTVRPTDTGYTHNDTVAANRVRVKLDTGTTILDALARQAYHARVPLDTLPQTETMTTIRYPTRRPTDTGYTHNDTVQKTWIRSRALSDNGYTFNASISATKTPFSVTTITRYWPSGGSVTLDGANGGFTSPGNVDAFDGITASADPASAGQIRGEKYGNFGFAALIPSGAGIYRVLIEHLARKVNSPPVVELQLQVWYPGGSSSYTFTPPDTTYHIYSQDVTAVRSWTRADLLDGSFYVSLRAKEVSGAAGVQVLYDALRVIVDYS